MLTGGLAPEFAFQSDNIDICLIVLSGDGLLYFHPRDNNTAVYARLLNSLHSKSQPCMILERM